MDQVIQQSGPFKLLKSEQGFAWTLLSVAGVRWYWHPQTQEWTPGPHGSTTPEEASVGFRADAPFSEASLRHAPTASSLRSPKEGSLS
jgi:hypothetical protein